MVEDERANQVAKGDYIAMADRGSTAIVAVYENISPRPVEQTAIIAARKTLTELPLEALATVGSLPSGSRPPSFKRNASFVGREPDLQRIASLLKRSEHATVVVTGLGGMGKSQLANEVVYRYGRYFAGGVFWLNFADANAVPTEVAACRTALRQELRLDIGTLPQQEQVQTVLSCWQNDLPRLLIFDNCEEEDLLFTWQPTTGGCRLLVTSRRAIWHPDLSVNTVPLDVLRREESVELLRKYRPDLSFADRDTIANEVADLPLALHLAGNYLHEYQDSRLGTSAAYLVALRRLTPLHHPSFQGGGITYTTGHIKNVERTFAVSYERLERENAVDEQALKLLARAAYFAPGEGISGDLLRATVGDIDDEQMEALVTQALNRLNVLGLLELQMSHARRMHRLLAFFVQERSALTDQEARGEVEQTLLKRSQDLNDAHYLTPMLALQPHLRTVTNGALQREDEMASNLCHTLGIHLYYIGAFTEAYNYFQWALAIREQQLGPEHSRTADSLNGLGLVYQAQGKYKQAEPLLVRALAICEQQLGPEHPNTAMSLDNLGALYQAQGKYEQAEPLYQRALAIREQQLGSEHPDMATSLNNLAELYREQGKYEQAEPLLVRALAIWEQQLGPEHPHTASSLSNLANLYLVQGKYERAEPLYQRALAIREQQLGSEHPDMATSLNNLAELYREQGKYEQAEPLLVRALAIWEQQLGPEHPHTAAGLNGLGLLYREQGKYEQAEPLYVRTLAICEQQLGPKHPNTASGLDNLGVIYLDQKKYEQAEPLLVRALAIREQQLGPEHPHTASSLSNLANLYLVQGKYERAEPLYQRALAIREQQLGSEHPDTAAICSNLGELYREQGKYEQAEPLLVRALAIWEQQLGSEHPNTAMSLNNLGLVYREQGKYEQAEPLLVRALAIREQQLGPEHPDTAVSRLNLHLFHGNNNLNFTPGSQEYYARIIQRIQETRDKYGQ